MPTIDELYENYTQQREVRLSLEQFTLFAIFFPALLVILSDGNLDSEERLHLERLARSLAHAFSEDGLGTKRIEELQTIFSQEFEYLIEHIEEWKEIFLQALNQHLKNFPESKETVLDTLHLFAETSEDVDEAEGDMIRYLSEKLDLMDTSF